MPLRITDRQRQAVLNLLARGVDRNVIAARVGVTPGQVSAVAAHVKMGTYENAGPPESSAEVPRPEIRERVHELLDEISAASRLSQKATRFKGVLYTAPC